MSHFQKLIDFTEQVYLYTTEFEGKEVDTYVRLIKFDNRKVVETYLVTDYHNDDFKITVGTIMHYNEKSKERYDFNYDDDYEVVMHVFSISMHDLRYRMEHRDQGETIDHYLSYMLSPLKNLQDK